MFLFSKQSVQLIDVHKLNYELVASWTVELGDLDQALHLWRYTGGFATIDSAKNKLAQDKVSLTVEIRDAVLMKVLLLFPKKSI
jgi:hypothetical protein